MPRDDQAGWVEPDIIINGRVLTFAECMSVRVAISSFRLSLNDPPFAAGLGETLAAGYDRHLANVEQTMLRRQHCDHGVLLSRPCARCQETSLSWGDTREKAE